MLVYPVTAPLITSGKSAFPRVAALTRELRWNPLALDIADAIVSSRAASVAELAAFLDAHGIGAVKVIEHEDDLPEVALLVAWAWKRLSPSARRTRHKIDRARHKIDRPRHSHDTWRQSHDTSKFPLTSNRLRFFDFANSRG